jgi:hypothetical protein
VLHAARASPCFEREPPCRPCNNNGRLRTGRSPSRASILTRKKPSLPSSTPAPSDDLSESAAPIPRTRPPKPHLDSAPPPPPSPEEAESTAPTNRSTHLNTLARHPTAAMSTAYGNFHDFCRDTGNTRSTLPVCNLFAGSLSKDNTGFGNGCELLGISLGGERRLANLGMLYCSWHERLCH